LVWSHVRPPLLGQLLGRLDDHDVDFPFLWPFFLNSLLRGSAFITFFVNPVSLEELLLDPLLVLMQPFQALLCTILSNVAIGSLLCPLKLLQLFLFYPFSLLDGSLIFKGSSTSKAAGTLEMSIAGAILH
jgi:hypothetical protein